MGKRLRVLRNIRKKNTKDLTPQEQPALEDADDTNDDANPPSHNRSDQRHVTKSGAQTGRMPNERLHSSLDENRERLEDLFTLTSDVVFRDLTDVRGTRLLLVYLDGLINTQELELHTIQPLLRNTLPERRYEDLTQMVAEQSLTAAQVTKTTNLYEAVDTILHGNALLVIDGQDEVLLLSVSGGTRRSVQEPPTEASIRGPREGFTENLRVNTALVRFKLKSHLLRTVPLTLGTKTRTSVVVMYLEDTADPQVIEEVLSRLRSIEIDGILESAYIEELIEDEPISPFPQLQNTERPDTVAAQLLEGRFAIFVDGTPFVLCGPVTFWQFLQASEDYYERYVIVNLIRWLRYTFLLIALYMPALYIAVTTYHQDMLPTNLLLSVAAARESIPFPALIEAMLMEISFEALREAGVRLPKYIGQAVSILGALVIGQAAVQAGIVSAPVVIIVSLTGIASFTIPRYSAAISIRMLRFPMMLLAGTFGLFGLVIGTIWLVTHLCRLRSFGVPYLSGVAPFKKTSQQDLFARLPLWKMIFRPRPISHFNRKRMGEDQMPAPPVHEPKEAR